MAESRIVSSERESLILVDRNDNALGHASKADCHDGAGRLHRAFSLFLFDDAGRLLLQQRAAAKRLWPGYWANSCCSHPRRGESLATATARRVQDELNAVAELQHVYAFEYHADYRGLGAEHEYCHVFVGRLHGEVQANPAEIAALRWVRAGELDAELDATPERFTPWLQLEWPELRGRHAAVLDAWCEPTPRQLT